MVAIHTMTKAASRPSLIWTAWLVVRVCGSAFGADASHSAIPNTGRDDEPTLSTGIMGVPWAFPLDEAGCKASFEETKGRAENGDVEAQYDLGVCYLEGNGVAKDSIEAVKWFRRAAEQGYAKAQRSLGLCYITENGVTKDEDEAVKWFRKAAAQGFAEAQSNLGRCYHEGEGVTQDYAEAAKWLRKAAEQGHALAQCGLGECYAADEGVAKDEVEAAKWFRKAADQGNDLAQGRLGVCYSQGAGVPQDYVEAHKWLDLASSQGLMEARELMSRAELEMTAQQIADALRLAREFMLRKVPAPGPIRPRDL